MVSAISAGTIMMREPIGAGHAAAVDGLARRWMPRLGDRAPLAFPDVVGGVDELFG